MLLAMVLRARPRGVPWHYDPLLLATAVLGLTWNLCALPAFQLTDTGIQGPFPFLTAIGFGALGLLPAVVVHSVLAGPPSGGPDPDPRAAHRGVRRECGRGNPPAPGGGTWRPAAVSARDAAPDLLVRRARRAARDRDARTARGAARDVDRRARRLRGVRPAPEPVPSRPGVVARRARRPPRLAPARLRDPLSGLPVRARRPVSQAGPRARRRRGRRLRRRRDLRRALGRRLPRSSRRIRARSASWWCSWWGPRCSTPGSGGARRGSSIASSSIGRTIRRSKRPSPGVSRPTTT